MQNTFIDSQNIFIEDRSFLKKSQTLFYHKFNAQREKDHIQFQAYILKHASMPYTLIKNIFQEISSFNNKNYLNSTFCRFLIKKVLPSLTSKRKEQTQKLIFGDNPKKQQIKLLNDAYEMNLKIRSLEVTEKEVDYYIEKNYPPFQCEMLKNRDNKKQEFFIEWFINHNLFDNLQILEVSQKLQRLEKFKKSFSQQAYVTNSKTRDSITQKQHTLILLKSNPNQTITLDDLFFNQRESGRKNYMSSYEFGTKLFYELCHFHKKNLDYYPDLSPFNVEYEIKTKNINLSLVPVFLDCVGMLNLPTNPQGLESIRNRKRYWAAPEELFKPKKINSKIILWKFLILVDYYERGYCFCSDACTKKQIQNKMDLLEKELMQENQQKYFGKLACDIIRFCREHGYRVWLDDIRRPPFEILNEFFSEKVMKKCLFNEEKKIYEEIKELPLKNKEPKLNLGEELLANSIILQLNLYMQIQAQSLKDEQRQNIDEQLKQGKVNLQRVIKSMEDQCRKKKVEIDHWFQNHKQVVELLSNQLLKENIQQRVFQRLCKSLAEKESHFEKCRNNIKKQLNAYFLRLQLLQKKDKDEIRNIIRNNHISRDIQA